MLAVGLNRQSRYRRRRETVAALVERFESRTLLSAFLVNSFDDAPDADPGDGVAEDAAGNTTLRAAVMEANAQSGDDQILLPAGTYAFGIVGTRENAARTGDLDITDTSGQLTIIGTTDAAATIDAAGLDRVFQVHVGASLKLWGVTITGGSASGILNHGQLTLLATVVTANSTTTDGGGILNLASNDDDTATVEIVASTIRDNRATEAGGRGGGISNVAANGRAATVTISDSVIEDNVARAGGGVYNHAQRGRAVATVTISDSLIAENEALYGGGGVYNDAHTDRAHARLVISSSVLRGNHAFYGGAVNASASLQSARAETEVIESTFDANTATRAGGALYNTASDQGSISTMRIIGSTLSGNSANEGGGVYNWAIRRNALARVEIANSTLSGNSALRYGGAVYNRAGRIGLPPDEVDATTTTLITDSTISGNSVTTGLATDAAGGGIYGVLLSEQVADAVALRNSIVAGNTAPAGPDLFGAITSRGFNLIGDTSDAGELAASDLLNVDPLLGPLGDNGGPTATFPLQNGSPAIDAGDILNATFSDQRGVERTQGPAVDIGAFEYERTGQAETVVLPVGGGSYQVILDAADLVVQRQGGPELFRRRLLLVESLRVEGSVDDDTLVVEFAGGDPVPSFGLAFHGMGESANGDALRLRGGSAAAIVHSLTDVDVGFLSIDRSAISYEGVEALADELITTDRVFRLFGDQGGQLRLSGGNATDDGLSQLTGDRLSRPVEFANPRGSLTFHGSDGDDVITLASVDPAFAASIAVHGQAGDDTLDASSFSQSVTLEGDRGNDTITGGIGGDSLVGGDGDDHLNGRGGHDTIFGEIGDDSLYGGSGSDRLDGGRQADSLYGQGSRLDSLTGGPGSDLLSGGSGTDVLVEAVNERIILTSYSMGGLGTDRISGLELAVLASGSNGIWIDASRFGGRVTLIGGSGRDRLTGGRRDDDLRGGEGIDTLIGGPGNDTLSGDAGDDMLNGGIGQDSLNGGAGHDRLFGGRHADWLDGGDGNDHLRGQGSFDTLFGRSGDDTLIGDSGGDRLNGGSGNDLLLGGDGLDRLLGGRGRDTLVGGLGNDVLRGQAGHDLLIGDAGHDWISGDAGSDTILGGAGNDTLLGGTGPDIVLGQSGDDLLNGQGHSGDTPAGGPGDDTVFGSSGETDESFVFFTEWADVA